MMIAQSRFVTLDLLAVLRAFSKHNLKVSNKRSKSKKIRSPENLLSKNAGPISKNKLIKFRLTLKKLKNSNN